MDKPSYYAIIPASVRYDANLKANSKLLYGEITSLANQKGYCYASNQYFADLYGVSKETASRWVKQLIKHGHITSQLIYKEGTKEIVNRYLRICQEGIAQNVNRGIDEKSKDNNTSNNNKVNSIDFLLLKDFLNKNTGREFRTINKSVQAKFNARLKDGYKKQDILNAIKNASSSQYHKDNGCQYLTPEFFSRAATLDKYGSDTNTSVEKVEVVQKMNDGEFVNF